MMNPLQGKPIFFAFISDDPKPAVIATDVKKMVQNANYVAANVLQESSSEIGSGELWRAEEFSQLMLKWLAHYYRYGLSKKMIRDLNAAMVGVKCRPWIYDDQEGGYACAYAIDFDHVPPVESIAALFFSSMALSGALNGLKRCESEECRNYFIGNAKAKWCSDTCGSRERLRDKRRRDKERQML